MNLIQSSFAYGGHDFSIVGDDQIVFAAGNAILIWNSSTGKKDYIWSKRNGYSLAIANYHKNLIAAAEYGINPDIHIYKLQGKELVARFKADTTIKLLDMVFSRDGKYLLMIGGIPDFRISVYDIENNKKLTIKPESKLPCKPAEYRKAKFNPVNDREFAILTSNACYFYTMVEGFEGQLVEGAGQHQDEAMDEDKEHYEVDQHERLSYVEYRNENPELSYVTFIWDQFKRVHICTDLNMVIQVDSKSAREESSLSLQARPLALLITQKHMIISLDDGMIQWYRTEIPEINFKSGADQQNDQNKLVITEDIDQEYKFEAAQLSAQIDATENIPIEPIAFMHYSRNYKKIIMGTQQGLIGLLAIEAEAINEDEEPEEDRKEEKETRVLETPFVELGRFHTKKVNGIRELGNTTQLITISDDQSAAIWEATSFSQLARMTFFSKPTAVDVSTDGRVAFIGTEKGVMRVFDVSNRAFPRLLKIYRFFESETMSINQIKCSSDGRFVIVSSPECESIFILSQRPEDEFEVYGFVTMEGYVDSSSFTIHEGKLKVVTVLSNSTIGAFTIPVEDFNSKKIVGNIKESLPEDVVHTVYRKIDKGAHLVIPNTTTGDLYVTGDDKLLKKYDFPTDHISKLDMKKAPIPPVEEHKSHDVGTTCWHISASPEVKFLVTGGRDGNFILRNLGNIAQSNEIKGHAVFSGGITAMTLSNGRSTLYTAGGDGAFFAWTIGNKPNPHHPIQLDKQEDEAIDRIEQIDDLPQSEIRPFREILEEQFHRQQASRKERFKEELMAELGVIRTKLNELLHENEKVTEIEKLERDEFVIDVERSAKVNQEGENICEEIRKEAEKTTLKLELLRERVQQSTWDKMEVQNKAVRSVKGDMLVFNYAVRKRDPQEQRRLNQVINFRRNELREKLKRIESKIHEVLDEKDFSRFKEGYIMNRVASKPQYEEDQSIQEAAASFAAKDAEKKSKKAQEEKKLQAAGPGAQAVQPGKRVPTLKITKGKLGAKTKKADDGDDAKNAQSSKMQQRDIKGMEEMYWTVKYQIDQLDDIKKKLESPNIWDLIYEAYELYSNPHKRMQIELLREVIFELKRDYNKDFDSLERFKEDQIFLIKEKNELIKELLANLKTEDELFEPDSHILENPDHIFDVKESDVKVEKYLTKEERARLEEERRKQEERELAMKGDNVGQRGLKTMMGGTELNLKKDSNLAAAELVREDWMNKPVEQMNEEEKYKFKEFLQKEKEFKDKQRKAWEQDLKKIKSEIIEIQLRFEERISTLFKKKLFFDVRIMEQELAIIRLTIILHDAKETLVDEKKFFEDKNKLETDLKTKEEELSLYYATVADYERRVESNRAIQEQDKEIRRMFNDVPNKNQLLNFVRQGRAKKIAVPAGGEASPRTLEMFSKVIAADPFSAFDKETVKSNLKDEDEKEVYSYEKDNIGGLTEEDFEKLVQERYLRIQFEKEKQKCASLLQKIKDHQLYLESLRSDVEQKYQTAFHSHKKTAERVHKLKYNFEVIAYLKQGQVEVPQLPVATDYKDAILVQRKVIEEQNKEIMKRGDAKVDKMEKISEFKTFLRKVRYQKKKLDLEIMDYEERAKDVQMYRVTKQTQEIIQGKHQKKDEEDKKRLENQIRQLDENVQKRIKTINETKKKLKKEIQDKLRENEQLETKARQLQQNVDQRKQIMGLKSKTGDDGGAQDPTKKIKEVAHKRKLMDIVKQQTEEIEFLRDELDRLRAKTFPSFAHLHNKPEYPDE